MSKAKQCEITEQLAIAFADHSHQIAEPWRGDEVNGAIFLVPRCPDYRVVEQVKAYMTAYLRERERDRSVDHDRDWHFCKALKALGEVPCERVVTTRLLECLARVRGAVRALDLSPSLVRVSKKGNYYLVPADFEPTGEQGW